MIKRLKLSIYEYLLFWFEYEIWEYWSVAYDSNALKWDGINQIFYWTTNKINIWAKIYKYKYIRLCSKPKQSNFNSYRKHFQCSYSTVIPQWQCNRICYVYTVITQKARTQSNILRECIQLHNMCVSQFSKYGTYNYNNIFISTIYMCKAQLFSRRWVALSDSAQSTFYRSMKYRFIWIF